MYILDHFPIGFLAVFFFCDEQGAGLLHQPPTWRGPGYFWSRFSSCSLWYANIRLQGSSASFGAPRVFYFPGTRHVWWAFPHPPPGEAPDGRPTTGGRRYYNCQWTQEDVETLYNLLKWKYRFHLHTLLVMYFLNLFPETLHVSADVSHHQVNATTSRNTGDKGQIYNRIK
jgi:hypothetical protein